MEMGGSGQGSTTSGFPRRGQEGNALPRPPARHDRFRRVRLQGPDQLTVRHNVASFDRLWKQIRQETGTRWHVEPSLYMAPKVSGDWGQNWADPNMRMLQFSVVRE